MCRKRITNAAEGRSQKIEEEGELKNRKEQSASCRQEKSDRMRASNIWQGSKIWQRTAGDGNSDSEMKTNTVALGKIKKISFSKT